MSITGKTTFAAVAAVVAAIALAVPAGADPNTLPCGLFSNPACAFVPLFPDLDHDVDLTTTDPTALNGDRADEPQPWYRAERRPSPGMGSPPIEDEANGFAEFSAPPAHL
jgi:hypothetical protein